ncbi:MAG: hypothetical protein ACREHG_01280 [Candidatus Saccharimonadales bacterium]
MIHEGSLFAKPDLRQESGDPVIIARLVMQKGQEKPPLGLVFSIYIWGDIESEKKRYNSLSERVLLLSDPQMTRSLCISAMGIRSFNPVLGTCKPL